MIDIDPRAVLALGKLQAFSRYRQGVPPAVYSAVGIVAVMAEDCAPCTQLGIQMAEKGDVDPAVLRGVARKNPALAAMAARPATVNGLPGFVLRESDGSIDTMAVEHRGGRIVAIYLMRNPEKLQHVRF